MACVRAQTSRFGWYSTDRPLNVLLSWLFPNTISSPFSFILLFSQSHGNKLKFPYSQTRRVLWNERVVQILWQQLFLNSSKLLTLTSCDRLVNAKDYWGTVNMDLDNVGPPVICRLSSSISRRVYSVTTVRHNTWPRSPRSHAQTKALSSAYKRFSVQHIQPSILLCRWCRRHLTRC